MMRRTLTAAMLLGVSWAVAVHAADEAGKAPEMTPEQKAEMDAYIKAGTPGAPHEGLGATAGTYSVKMKNWHEPGAAPMEETGTARRSMILDGRVLVEQFTGTMMGSTFTGHGMTGYDNTTGKYWSTWMDSMSTGLMVSEGTCNAQRECTFKGSWNDPVKKTVVHSRMTTRWTDPKTEVFEMYGPDRKGQEMKMMEMTYTRQ
jgi:hypothetical protein